MDMLPRHTLMSWGSSSSDVQRMNAPKGVMRRSVRRACNDVVSIFANRHTAELPDFDLPACKSVAVLLEQDWARAGLPDADRDGKHGHGQEQQCDRADDDVLESLEPSACAREGGFKHADCRYPADFHPVSMQWILLKRLRDAVQHALVDMECQHQAAADGGNVPYALQSKDSVALLANLGVPFRGARRQIDG
jgi:hypothetical protein